MKKIWGLLKSCFKPHLLIIFYILLDKDNFEDNYVRFAL